MPPRVQGGSPPSGSRQTSERAKTKEGGRGPTELERGSRDRGLSSHTDPHNVCNEDILVNRSIMGCAICRKNMSYGHAVWQSVDGAKKVGDDIWRNRNLGGAPLAWKSRKTRCAWTMGSIYREGPKCTDWHWRKWKWGMSVMWEWE